VHAEWYLAVQAGLPLPGSLSDAKLTSTTIGGGVNGARVADINYGISPTYGVKTGYFPPHRDWLGVEADLFTTQLNVKQQTVIGGIAGSAGETGKVFADTLLGTQVQLTTVALNLIIREPSLHQRFQPYGGAGPALFPITSSSGSTRFSFGLNLVAGARVFVTPQWALFGEFKYQNANIKFEGIEGNYRPQIFVFGVSYHFRDQFPSPSPAASR
jgi:opacity protein-like surface antigen